MRRSEKPRKTRGAVGLNANTKVRLEHLALRLGFTQAHAANVAIHELCDAYGIPRVDPEAARAELTRRYDYATISKAPSVDEMREVFR